MSPRRYIELNQNPLEKNTAVSGFRKANSQPRAINITEKTMGLHTGEMSETVAESGGQRAMGK